MSQRAGRQSYDYVRRYYRVAPTVGHRARHTVIGKFGIICREHPSHGHRVMVRFDGERHRSYCHPTELEYLGRRMP
jgi:hypothetical protein